MSETNAESSYKNKKKQTFPNVRVFKVYLEDKAEIPETVGEKAVFRVLLLLLIIIIITVITIIIIIIIMIII